MNKLLLPLVLGGALFAGKESEADGPIVLRVEPVFLDPTDYSALR